MFQDFVALQVLTATQVDGIMRQTVLPFASSAARDTALAGVLAEGMVVFLQDAPNRLMYYDGAAWRYILSEAVAFTPSWTNLSIGNGVQQAAYSYVGNRLLFEVALAFGTSTSISGNVSLALPNSHAATGANTGASGLLDSSAGQTYIGGWSIGNTQTSMTLISTSGIVSPTVPFTWATGDNINLSGHVRIL